MNPYLRRIEVLVGPMMDWERSDLLFDQLAMTATRFYADGTPDNLRISCRIAKHIMTTSTPTTIDIYNLKEETRDQLQQPGLSVVVNAGWENSAMFNLASMSLFSAVSRRQGPDIITTISGLAGYGGMNRTIVSESFNQGANLKQVIMSLARKIPGLSVEEANIIVDPTIEFGSAGYTTQGPVRDALNRLGRTYGFTWNVNDGKFWAYTNLFTAKTGKPTEYGEWLQDDIRKRQNTAIDVSAATGLSRVELALVPGASEQLAKVNTYTGVTTYSTFNPLIQPGRFIRVTSITNPDKDKTQFYMCHTVDHRIDSHGMDAETVANTLMVGL